VTAGRRSGRRTFRLATWNLWWRHGEWEQRQPAILETLRTVGADVVALQEVASADPDQPSMLATDLGLEVVTAPDESNDRFHLVNAVASRWPIVESSWLYLDVGDMPPHRTLLRARVAAPFGDVDVYCTHLSHGFDQSGLRQLQVRQIAEEVASRRVANAEKGMPGYPAVLLGDLNAVPDSDEVRMLTGRSAPAADGVVFTDAWEQLGDGPGATYSAANPFVNDSAWPERRLDYVMVGWPRPRPAGNPIEVSLFGTEPVCGTVPSDHFGVVAELVVPEIDPDRSDA